VLLINIARVGNLECLKALWHAETQRLNALEDELALAWDRFAQGKGSPPSQELLAAVSLARREADTRLQALLAEMTVNKPAATAAPTAQPGTSPPEQSQAES
jgi:hypothetical protein